MKYCLQCSKTIKKGNKFCVLDCAYKYRVGKPSGALGKRWTLTEETKKKQSKSWKKRKLSDSYSDFLERSRKQGLSNRGMKMSDETRKKMSESHKANPLRYWFGKKNEKITGDKHPNWKGGITPYKIKLRKSADYKRWRSAVYKRDKYTCVICGDNKGGNLEADHHPIQFKDIYTKEDISKLWDINNGRTLCKKCHKKKTHGYKN